MIHQRIYLMSCLEIKMIIEIILGITTLTLGFTTYNQMRKVERLETWVENYSKNSTN